MNKGLTGVLITLVGTLVFFALVIVVGGALNPSLKLDQTAFSRFVVVAIGLLMVFLVYWLTRESKAWVVGTREVVYMAIGAALYAVLSFIFNGTVFVVPSVSQVALRPAIVIPMFFGYAFGPVVGFFSGAVGNMFGDALTGFGLSPQWSVGNGLIGLISGMWMLFPDKKKSLNSVFWTSAALTGVVTIAYILFRNTPNMLFFDPANNIFGDATITAFAGLSVLIGFLFIAGARLIFRKNLNVVTAVTWASLGNLIGIGFAALSDIWINGFTAGVAIVGEFIPAAGTNMIFAAILLPLLVLAYDAVQRQTGR